MGTKNEECPAEITLAMIGGRVENPANLSFNGWR